MSGVRTVAETVGTVADLGARRASASAGWLLAASVLAGLYIAFGGALAIRAGGGMPAEWGPVGRLAFAGVFPLGLLLVVFGGAALFTGDVMYVSAALMRKKTPPWDGIRALCVSWTGNLLGALALALMIHLTGIFLEGGPSAGLAPYAASLAASKCSQGFLPLFVKGILCNQLVCLALFMSLSAQGAAAKALLLWPPIFGFVALGMEHSVANMFFIPIGILSASHFEAYGMAAPCGWGDFFLRNLVPVTLGNVVGGWLFVAAPYCLCFRETPDKARDGAEPRGSAGRR
ncbi:MAG: formate/nitrite transporter family protein [Deltaproteobacteria bacterium]|nr:formate/nitrite transporter family protein [Deltaproteobacteria bacterium]